MNSITFAGRIIGDIVQRGSEKKFTTFTVLEKVYVKGEYEPIWRRCIAFGGLGQRIYDRAEDRDDVTVAATEEPNKYENKDGETVETTQYVVRDIALPFKGKATSDTKATAARTEDEVPEDSIPF